MTHIPSHQELDTWIAQGIKSLRAASSRADAIAVYRERQAQVSGWHPGVAKQALAKLAEAGKKKFNG